MPEISGACTSNPIRNPRFARAEAAVEAPVPPFSSGMVPVNAAASTGMEILVDPSKATPLIVRGVSKVVALAAKFAELAWLATVSLGKRPSTYCHTAFVDGYFSLEAESERIELDLLVRDSLVVNLAKTKPDTGLSTSAVLSTLPSPKFDRAATAVVAPVPPEVIGKVPLSFPASSEKCA